MPHSLESWGNSPAVADIPIFCPLPLSPETLLPIINFKNKITCDDKGLTAIFVFGLSGSDTADPPCRSVMAALDSLKIVQKMEMGTWTAGVSAGFCFCGPVGNIKTRCEYVIMGGAQTTVFSFS